MMAINFTVLARPLLSLVFSSNPIIQKLPQKVKKNLEVTVLNNPRGAKASNKGLAIAYNPSVVLDA